MVDNHILVKHFMGDHSTSTYNGEVINSLESMRCIKCFAFVLGPVTTDICFLLLQ